MTRTMSCGVVVTDGARVLIAHATRSPRWDIPKGVAEPGESAEQAARRELLEETGLEAPPDLVSLGQHAYLPRKDLALFTWHPTAMPDPSTLICRSTFLVAGTALPEFDRFACVTWTDALPRLGKSMIAVLTPIAQSRRWI